MFNRRGRGETTIKTRGDQGRSTRHRRVPRILGENPKSVMWGTEGKQQRAPIEWTTRAARDRFVINRCGGTSRHGTRSGQITCQNQADISLANNSCHEINPMATAEDGGHRPGRAEAGAPRDSEGQVERVAP